MVPLNSTRPSSKSVMPFMKRHITHGWTLASHLKAALMLAGVTVLAVSDVPAVRAADASKAAPSAADTSRDEEARRVLRDTLAKIDAPKVDAPKPAAEVPPSLKAQPTEAAGRPEISAPAPTPQSAAVGDQEKAAPVETPAKTAAAEAVT